MSILNQYSNALIDFSAERLKVFPYCGDPNAPYASVRTEVQKADGSFVDVEYSLRRTTDGWKVWDVVIERISYVKSLRDEVGEVIAQGGLERAIDKLESSYASNERKRPLDEAEQSRVGNFFIHCVIGINEGLS